MTPTGRQQPKPAPMERGKGKGNLILITHAPNINTISLELMKLLDLLVIDPKGEEDFEELGITRFSESKVGVGVRSGLTNASGRK